MRLKYNQKIYYKIQVQPENIPQDSSMSQKNILQDSDSTKKGKNMNKKVYMLMHCYEWYTVNM